MGLKICEVCDLVGSQQVGKNLRGGPSVLKGIMRVVMRNAMTLSNVAKSVPEKFLGVEAPREFEGAESGFECQDLAGSLSGGVQEG
jgi:hypothetical protein